MEQRAIKIAIVNTFQDFGGAAVAAQRLHKALQDQPLVEPQLLVQVQSQKQQHLQAVANTWWGKKRAFLRFTVDRLLFWRQAKSKATRYAISPAYIGTNISQHPLIKQADIIHLHWIVFGFLSLKSLKTLFALGKPIVWTMHDMWAFTGGCHHARNCDHYQQECGNCVFLKHPHPKDLSYRIFQKKLTIYENKSLHLVGCSQWIANEATKSGLMSAEVSTKSSIQSIPNPIDTTVYTPLDKKLLRQQRSLAVDKKYLLFGSVKISDKRKGIDYFLEALQILKELYPATLQEVELLVFGGAGEQVKALSPYTVHLQGLLSGDETLRQNYNLGDALVMPSLEENLPNTIMESMACGTPAIAFDVGGVSDLIDHQQNGYLASYKSAEDLAKGIYWVLYQADNQTLTQNARRKVLNNFTEEVVSNQYVQLYKKILDQK
ncbi:glycosyltransferase family 4 protein [Microscilla marina]|uniref:Glycosyl transferase, group 1 family protein n=1 Tax=Microscilla marina ATCC 23134 TaxID=313606 RepID=A1ZTZ4_MICM2|nr:glycosyltransferase family 4 protein [Microscilla marina]EAY26107.1 glycosyl transferase, group 1 family protein [Microscilla marina ATCC 23134]